MFLRARAISVRSVVIRTRTTSSVTLCVSQAPYFSASRLSKNVAHGHDHHSRGSGDTTHDKNGAGDDEYTSSSSTHRAAADTGSPFEQFNAQRQKFYSHSFHEKGSTHTSSSSSSSTSSNSHSGQDQDGQGDHADTERVMGRGSATAQERRHLSRQWENAFFGRVHFESGMHDRYAAAVAAEEDEAVGAGGGEASPRPNEADMSANARQSNRELFPNWPEDEEAPLLEFKKLPHALQARYILNRLTMGERRVRYAADYGSLSMMYQLNLGERMINEAESLLMELGWMNDSLRGQIEAVKDEAYKVKYDYDLD